MKFHTFPKALYEAKGVTVLLDDGDNYILHKKLQEDVANVDILTVSHAIVYVVNGTVEVCHDDETIMAQNGEIIFMPRDSYMVSDYVRHGKDLEVFLLFFNHEIALNFLGDRLEKRHGSKRVCKLNHSQNIEYFFETVQKMQFTKKPDKAFLTLKILEFLHLLIQENASKFINTLYASEVHKQKRSISTMMLEHYDKNLTVSDFASLSGLSLSTFNREFKRIHHTTPKQWLIEKRMHKALALLDEGYTVTQVAFDVGYLNVSNFIKAYKSIHGSTPKSMQKALAHSK